MVGVPFFEKQMRRRTIAPDRLSLALLQAKRGDDRWTEEENEEQPRSRGAHRAEREVAKQMEDAGQVRNIGQPRQH